jgi:hypothetical protein
MKRIFHFLLLCFDRFDVDSIEAEYVNIDCYIRVASVGLWSTKQGYMSEY